MSGETAAERWSPAQRAESVLISILSLLDDAEVSSPANVDAGVMLRKDPDKYKQMVGQNVEASKKDIPEGFLMPTHESTSRPEKLNLIGDEDFWVDDEDDEDTFGGSDSDEEMTEDQESGSEDEEEDDEETDQE